MRQIKPGLDGDLLPLRRARRCSPASSVAFIEETFFRGILFTAVARTSGARAAIIAPSVLYAALHFLGGKLRVPPEEVSWVHGFEVLSRLFERYAQPLAFVDSFLALVALGILLALVRLRTGAIAACIGLHAAGVCTIFILRDTTAVNGKAKLASIVGTYDGVIGWAAFVWFAAIVVAYCAGTRISCRRIVVARFLNVQPRLQPLQPLRSVVQLEQLLPLDRRPAAGSPPAACRPRSHPRKRA